MIDRSTLLLAVVVLVVLAIVPVAWVLFREAIGRFVARRGIDRTMRARRLLAERRSAGVGAEQSAREVAALFDPLTMARAMEAELRERSLDAGAEHDYLLEVARRSGLAERWMAAVRQARRWTERTHAVEMLGLLALPEAVPALVAALRDPYEDESSVKVAAARALARIQAPEAVPLLVHELREVDEWSSPRIADALVAFGAAAVPALLEMLDEAGSTRGAVWAARVLGRIGDGAAMGRLVQRLQDRSDAVRIASAEALGHLRDARALPALVRATLRDPVAQVRAQAAGALGRVGDPLAVDALVGALADPDFGTRIVALEALETVRPPDTAPIERALRDHNAEVRRRAALALERVGWLDRCVEDLGSEDRAVARRATARVLELGRAGLVDGISAHLYHPRFAVRARIVECLGDLGDHRAGPPLLAVADDPSWPVRARLAEALGKLRLEGGARVLASLLDDPEATVAENAAEALGALPGSAVSPLVAHLVAAFDRSTPVARARLVECLARLRSADTTDVLLHAADDPAETVRAPAVRALGGLGDGVGLDELARRLSDPSKAVKIAAVDALAMREGDEPLEILIGGLPGAGPAVRERITDVLARSGGHLVQERLAALARTEADRDLRLGIIWTLGKLGAAEAVPVLAALVGDPDPRIRASAAGALGKIPGEESRRALIGATEDRDARTRAAAVNALARAGGATPGALDALASRLADPDPFVRNRAALALGRLGGADAEARLGDPETASRVDEVTLLVARSLLGTEVGIEAVTRALADPEVEARFRALVRDQDEDARALLFQRLLLENVPEQNLEGLERTVAIERYHRLVAESQDPDARRLAAVALSRLGGELGVQILADALGTDPSELVRLRIVQLLAEHMHSEAAIAAVARAASDPVSDVALVAVRALGRSTDVSLGELLFDRLGAGTPELAQAVEESLASLYAKDSARFVDRLLGVDDKRIVVAGIRILGRLGTPNLGRLLAELARSGDVQVQVASVRAMSGIPGPDASRVLAGFLRHAVVAVRLAAAESLFAREGALALPRLSELQSDPSVPVRCRLAELAAAGTWWSTGPLLEPMLDDPSPSVRATVMVSLLEQGDPEGLQCFRRAWSTCEPEVLRRLREDHRAQPITRSLADLLGRGAEPSSREVAVLGLAALAVPGHEEHVLKALSDPSPTVRIAVIGVLGSLERPEVRQCLTELLSDPDDRVREAARRATLRVVR